MYTDPTGRCANNWCAAGIAYGYAETDEERLAAARAMANSNPALGLTVGAALPFVETAQDLGRLAGIDTGAPRIVSPEAALAQAQAEMAAVREITLFGPGAYYLKSLGQRIVHNTDEFDTAWAKDDFVGVASSSV